MEDNSLWLDRTRMLIGNEGIKKLKAARVAVLGLGGVGGAASEALCRAGIGSMILIDHDSISETNLNRQLFATFPMVGASKVKAAEDRLHSINPALSLVFQAEFFCEENAAPLLEFKPDFIIDAIDSVSSKLFLARLCREKNIPLISCMGTGNRLNPSKFTVGTISDTSGCGCGLARIMRRELRVLGITDLPVVFSSEQPRKTVIPESGRHVPASISFCPPVAGYLLAGFVVNSLIA